MKKSYVRLLLSGLVLLMLMVICGCGTQQAEQEQPEGTQQEEQAEQPERTQQVDQTVSIATKPMTEQFILGEMLALLIEDQTDLKVEITKGIGGGTSNIHPAIIKGDFDMYPEYTGTGWSFVLKEEGFPPDDELYEILQSKYLEEYNLRWVGLYGFNNTYTLAMHKDEAQQQGISTYSDLAEFSPQLVFGAEYDFFEREDGYDALCSTYDYEFRQTRDMDIGLKYMALQSKEVDVINAFTTDGQLSADNLIVLQDDRKFFNTYYCGTVVREETLQKYPELESVLLMMENIITDAQMAALNNEVETNNRDEREVAREFLISQGKL